jgi:hypothetical protein
MVLFGGQMVDRRRRYASAVALWLESAPEDEDNPRNVAFFVHVKNDGVQPIYHSSIDVHVTGALEQQVITEGEALSALLGELIVAAGAGFSRRFVLPEAALPSPEIGSVDFFTLTKGGKLTVSLSFRDAEGRAWRRDSDGRLRRLSDRHAGQ